MDATTADDELSPNVDKSVDCKTSSRSSSPSSPSLPSLSSDGGGGVSITLLVCTALSKARDKSKASLTLGGENGGGGGGGGVLIEDTRGGEGGGGGVGKFCGPTGSSAMLSTLRESSSLSSSGRYLGGVNDGGGGAGKSSGHGGRGDEKLELSIPPSFPFVMASTVFKLNADGVCVDLRVFKVPLDKLLSLLVVEKAVKDGDEGGDEGRGVFIYGLVKDEQH